MPSRCWPKVEGKVETSEVHVFDISALEDDNRDAIETPHNILCESYGSVWRDGQNLNGWMNLVLVSDKHCVVLMSGGIDSAATLAAWQGPSTSLSGMFVDYGQSAAQSEWQAARSIASHYEIEIDKVDLGVSLVSDRGEFFGRNALFILTAAGTIPTEAAGCRLGYPCAHRLL